MDLTDITNCLMLIEDALNSDIFKTSSNEIRTDRLINKLELKMKRKMQRIEKENNTASNKSTSNKSISNKSASNKSVSNKSDTTDISITSESNSSLVTNLSGNYSNIKPITINSDLFNISESCGVDSNSCYNLAFLYKKHEGDTEVDAKIITYRK
jgi:hypothetical protein